jgi:hypothetical protein
MRAATRPALRFLGQASACCSGLLDSAICSLGRLAPSLACNWIAFTCCPAGQLDGLPRVGVVVPSSGPSDAMTFNTHTHTHTRRACVWQGGKSLAFGYSHPRRST